MRPVECADAKVDDAGGLAGAIIGEAFGILRRQKRQRINTEPECITHRR
jgi:hypothetical protein